MGQEETAAAVHDNQEFYLEFMNFADDRGSATGDGGDGLPMEMCDFCSAAPALVYCRADKARLCLPCDRHVHAANGVSSRHRRSPLCSACQASPAAARSGDRFLCTNCDFDRHGGMRVVADTLRDGRAVEGYTECPPASEIAAILGVADFEKAAGFEDGGNNDAWWSAGWEEPQVLTLEDLIIPTTSCHNFQPLMLPSSPKNPNPEARKYREEIIRQLHELVKSEGIQDIPVEEDVIPAAAAEQLHPWGAEYNLQGCNLSFENNNYEVAPTIAVAAAEDDPWNSGAFIGQPENYSGDVLYEQSLVSSTEASLCSFVEMADICPGGIRTNTGSSENNLTAGAPVIPMRGGYEIGGAERDTILSRYKEKRKTRRYDKLVRYESRKARADGRTRIKGRFAKIN